MITAIGTDKGEGRDMSLKAFGSRKGSLMLLIAVQTLQVACAAFLSGLVVPSVHFCTPRSTERQTATSAFFLFLGHSIASV